MSLLPQFGGNTVQLAAQAGTALVLPVATAKLGIVTAALAPLAPIAAPIALGALATGAVVLAVKHVRDNK